MSTIKTDNENLVLHAEGAKNVEIQTNGSTKLTVKSDGKIGIGTTNPTEKLDIVGNVKIQGTTRVGYLQVTPGNNVSEGGEIRLEGAASYSDVQIDNYQGNIRIHTLGTGKSFDILGGDGLHVTNGYVSAPNQPSFWATCTENNYALPGGGKMAMSDVQYNRGNHYNGSTSEFTVPVNGVYRIWLGVFSTSDNGFNERYQVVRNGNKITYPYILGGGRNHQPTSGSMDLELSANDTIYIGVQYNTQEIYAGHTGWGMTLLS